MAVARREKNPRAHVVANCVIVTVRISGVIGLYREGERPNKFLGHAAREIGDFVMPVISIEAAIGGAVRVSVLQREKFGNVAQGEFGEQVAAGEITNHSPRGFSIARPGCRASGTHAVQPRPTTRSCYGKT